MNNPSLFTIIANAGVPILYSTVNFCAPIFEWKCMLTYRPHAKKCDNTVEVLIRNQINVFVYVVISFSVTSSEDCNMHTNYRLSCCLCLSHISVDHLQIPQDDFFPDDQR